MTISLSTFSYSDILIRAALGTDDDSLIVDHHSGRNDVAGVTQATVWPQGGLYTYTDYTTPVPYFMSSSDVGDVGTVEMDGCGAEYVGQGTAVEINGQTKTEIANLDWIRINHAIWREPVTNAGIIYVYEDSAVVAGVPSDVSKIRAIIEIGKGQANQAVYTIMAGYVGLLMYYRHSSESNQEVKILAMSRQRGESFIVIREPVEQTDYVRELILPARFESMSDIEVRAQSAVGTNPVSAEFSFLLIKSE